MERLLTQEWQFGYEQNQYQNIDPFCRLAPGNMLLPIHSSWVRHTSKCQEIICYALSG
jgi:hypothetical protein